MQFLEDEGVEFIFGYPGGAVLHIYDEIYRQQKIKHILVRHEQGAFVGTITQWLGPFFP